MMLNVFEIGVLGYFLQHIDDWNIHSEVQTLVNELCPDIIHVNDPTCPKKLKEISLFLFFSCYSVKELLNEDMKMFRAEMNRLIPDFDHVHAHWINTQPTVAYSLNPRALNEYHNMLEKSSTLLDYNTCVDKVLQISPCYDLVNKG